MSEAAPETINVMVGTAGHIDHGKTELVKLLTGCDTDTLREEKERGMSIDLGFAPCQLATGKRVGIVDVPGHERFIRNMVAGATGIDLVLLVVAADDGVMPQTREHLALVELLGVRKGMTAVTKIDRVDEARRAAVLEEVRQFLQGTFLAEAPVVGVSPITGEGFTEFYNALNAALEGAEPRPTTGVFRMPVERVFTVAGYGTVATGIPVRGTVRVGDTLELLPQGLRARVRGLQVYHVDGREARAGECAALNLTGVKADDLGRGRVLATPDSLTAAAFIRVNLKVLPELPVPLRKLTQVHFHVGTAEVNGRVVLLEGNRLAPGATALAEVRLEEPVVAAPGDRYVVRGLSPLTTIGGGEVLEVAEHKVRPRPATLEDLGRRRDALGEPTRWVHYLVESAGERGIDSAELRRDSLLTQEQLEPLLGLLSGEGVVLRLSGGRAFLSRTGLEQAATRLRERLSAFHKERPLHAGIEREKLAKELKLPANVVEAVARHLVGAGELVEEQGLLRLRGFEVPLSPQQRELARRVEALYRERPFSAPDLGDAATELGAPTEELEQLGRLLQQRGMLIRLGEKVILHREALEQARTVILAHLRERGQIRAAELRDLLETSRKYAIALLDYFDRIGLLLRRENIHYLRPGGERAGDGEKE